MKEMRRKDRQMDEAFAYSIIDKAEFGTLATTHEDGTPYCIPLSVARLEDKVYFHCAREGSKIDAIRRNPMVCISFVGDVQVPPPIDAEEIAQNPELLMQLTSNKFTTEYESAVAFGTATIVEDEDEKILGLKLICEKYVPENMPYFDAAIEKSFDITCVVRIDIEGITGKRKKLDKDGVEMKWGRME